MLSTYQLQLLMEAITDIAPDIKEFKACRTFEFNLSAIDQYPLLFLDTDFKVDYTPNGNQSNRNISFRFIVASRASQGDNMILDTQKELSKLEMVGTAIVTYLKYNLTDIFCELVSASAISFIGQKADDTLGWNYECVMFSPFATKLCDEYLDPNFDIRTIIKC